MRLLVLGGTQHVGRAVVETALARGDVVTTVNRGLTRAAAPGVEALTADRTDVAALRLALAGREWDAVIDTWSGAPRVVRDAAELLAGRAGHYGYVSSRSVYAWPMPLGADESAPLAGGDADDSTDDDYAAAKRGGELAALRAFGDRALLARAGLILGPYENVGRMPWWLRRISRGGRVLAPERSRPLQYIDARDLAAWMLSAASRGIGGAFNAVGRPGICTMGELLEEAVRVTGSDAELVWVSPSVIEKAGISPWTELPIWLPQDEEYGGMHDADVSAAYENGLTCRPMPETIADTWAWLQAEGDPAPRPDRPPLGLDPAKEQRVLDEIAGDR
ncbi:NAD-dependent epimerase/dehydratase family protein [Actinomadura sp. DC4]|uniref:NAD-dependent epimerase/dehydratase family protein n=1 Tax=Actinomadura sp. DC4 TaxID=3055069 RepID=UPI0025AEF743|nr:NAD-dependent epimerase/dehydratase family protein [Actinomadura sp. DC4]MDN3352364.1 NAD-dependent epimerase/dehydratase family protein [Actinomadura sp. DC4]